MANNNIVNLNDLVLKVKNKAKQTQETQTLSRSVSPNLNDLVVVVKKSNKN